MDAHQHLKLIPKIWVQRGILFPIICARLFDIGVCFLLFCRPHFTCHILDASYMSPLHTGVCSTEDKAQGFLRYIYYFSNILLLHG